MTKTIDWDRAKFIVGLESQDGPWSFVFSAMEYLSSHFGVVSIDYNQLSKPKWQVSVDEPPSSRRFHGRGDTYWEALAEAVLRANILVLVRERDEKQENVAEPAPSDEDDSPRENLSDGEESSVRESGATCEQVCVDLPPTVTPYGLLEQLPEAVQHLEQLNENLAGLRHNLEVTNSILFDVARELKSQPVVLRK